MIALAVTIAVPVFFIDKVKASDPATIAALSTLLATSSSVFIGLLPVSYTFWHGRFVARIERESRDWRNLGDYAVGLGINEIEFRCNSAMPKLRTKVDISRPPRDIQRIEAILRGRGTLTVRGPDHNLRALSGLNDLANMMEKRAYRVFVLVLVVFSLLLVSSAFSLIVVLPEDFPLSGLLIGLFALSVFLFILYSTRMFIEPNIGFTAIGHDGTTGYVLDDILWRAG
jgi:hypothetical protein